MAKRIVVAGCRDFDDYETAKDFMDLCLSEIGSEEVIILCGDCNGADKLGERYALEHSFPVEHYPAQWDLYGRSAGPVRNAEMAKKCDAVIAFWDGKSKGTASMIKEAEKSGKTVKIKMI